ncbi:MAG: hypothetical protein HY907_07565 [Deltaproteobacteria bacterium]|nr:hypothetical protein [Deltaproteobacteria bacterium]
MRLLSFAAFVAWGCGHDWSAAGDTGTESVPGDAEDLVPDEPEADGDADADDDDAAPTDDGAPDGDEWGTEFDGDDDGGDDVDGGHECAVDSDCDDGDPCTLDRCDADARCGNFAQPDDTSCGTDSICCAGACVGALDPAHCLTCDRTCSPGPHGAALCLPSGCGLSCEPGWGHCNADFVDGCETALADDESHCGGCGTGCSEGESCVASDCVASWQPVTDAGAPTARRHHRASWTGTEMIVWGGTSGSALRDGGRYRPADGTWTTMAAAPGAMDARYRHVQEWTGTGMIVWGGTRSGGLGLAADGGGLYDPTGNTWAIIDSGTIERSDPTSVWTGTEMLVWGGLVSWPTAVRDDGVRYDPATDNWEVLPPMSWSSPRWSAVAVWTGTTMLVWGGWRQTTGTPSATGDRFDPATGAWRAMSTTGAPAARGAATAVWTGSELLVWGGATSDAVGSAPSGSLGDGGAYDPAADTWRAISPIGAPSARHHYSAVWTGTRMIVWGGQLANGDPALGDGAAYDPATDTWTPITMFGAPAARRGHTAIWTGTEMVVWGGSTVTGSTTVHFRDGGRFTPRE